MVIFYDMVKKRWVVLGENGKDLKEVLLRNRNIEDKDSFFKPHLHKLTAPEEIFPEIDIVVKRIKKAIKNKELIYIYGDFDVDGITAAAILWETIDFLGGKVLPFIPHRQKQGYGIHAEALETFAKAGAKVVISVDCGITAVDEAEVAKKLSLDFIITDHHTKQSKVPKPFALLHTTNLAGSGVAFVLAKALLERFSKKDDEQIYKNLELASLGTIADMVPLLGDNRIIVANGLKSLTSTNRIGLRALYDEVGITRNIGTKEVGFMIAPRLNAAGRMENAMDALRLLLTKKKERARDIAAKLSETNKKRREATMNALTHARQNLNGSPNSKILIVHHESYLEGIVGLVAGRLAEENNKPAVVISQINPMSKGSARSIKGFNIAEAIKSASKYLDSYGGHPMAAGFSLVPEKILKFKEELEKFAQKAMNTMDLTPSIQIDYVLREEAINQQNLQTIKTFEPFGIGNPEPMFLTRNFEVVDARTVGNQGKHLRLVLRSSGNAVHNAIGFGMGERSVKKGDQIDAVFNLQENNWQNRKDLQLKLKDFKPSRKS